MLENSSDQTLGLRHEYKIYKRQKCFVDFSHEAEWSDDIVNACAEVLPKFGLEPWYAADHFDPTKPLRDKLIDVIANARYGIYDLSNWRNRNGDWHLPRNIFIELGMAIALNRPALLLRHTSNRALPLPDFMQGVELVEFTGEVTLRKTLEERLPQWLNVPPDQDWLSRFCIFGNRECVFREEHPRVRQWSQQKLVCHISDGLDINHPDFQKEERSEIRGAFEGVLSRYNDLLFEYLDELSLVDGYQYLLCSYCQTVRSTPFAVYRILPQTPAAVFVIIGMSIALEMLFEYTIPKILLVRSEEDVPSLLRGYEVVEATNSSEVKRKLGAFIPDVMENVRQKAWKPKPLPFHALDIVDWMEFGIQIESVKEKILAGLMAFREKLSIYISTESDLYNTENFAQSLYTFLSGYLSSINVGTSELVIRSTSYPVTIDVRIGHDTYAVVVLNSWEAEEETDEPKWVEEVDKPNTFVLLFERTTTTSVSPPETENVVRVPLFTLFPEWEYEIGEE